MTKTKSAEAFSKWVSKCPASYYEDYHTNVAVFEAWQAATETMLEFANRNSFHVNSRDGFLYSYVRINDLEEWVNGEVGE